MEKYKYPLQRHMDLNLKYPELREVLQKFTWQISDEEMIMMNYEVEENKKSESDVAREFLNRKGLI